MRNPPVVLLVLLAALIWVGACQSRSGGERADGTSPREQPIRLTDVPPPPGVDARHLTPFKDQARELAQHSLDEIRQTISAPSWLLPSPPAPEVRPESPPETPPLAAQKFFAAGRIALIDGDNFQAVQQFEKALRLSPGNPRLLASLGEAWTRAGNRVSAANHYRQAFAADPADLSSLLMLGRFALEDRRWDQAIAILDHALALVVPEEPRSGDPANRQEAGPEAGSAAEGPDPDPDIDPATAPLIRFYLANALNQAGYARAAAEAYRDYLEGDRNYTRASPHAQELAVIDAQQGETLMLVGDLHHRLDEPRRAWELYRLAARVSVLNRDGLRRRLIYTRLRLGQTRAAEDLVVEAVIDERGTPHVLELLPYVVEHGVSAGSLAQRLTDLYETQDRPAALALAMADTLPRDAAIDLLNEHLAEKPGDDAVFGRLIALLVDVERASAGQNEQALRATARAMRDSPDLADAYADRLIANVDDPAALLRVLDRRLDLAAMPPAEAATFLTLRGKLHLAADQPDAAMAAYVRALDLDESQQLARLELASLHVERGDFAAADELLAPLASSNHPRAAELRVRTLIETGQDAAALALLDEVLRRSPPGSPLMMDKAGLLLRLDRVAEAERVLLDALNARPTDEAIYQRLLDIYDTRGDMVRNYQRLVRRMIDTIPRARVTRLELAALQLASRDFASAEKLLDGLLQENPDDAEAQRMLFEVYAGTDRRDAFTSLFDSYFARPDVQPDEDLLRLAEAYLRKIEDEARLLRVIDLRLASQPPSFQRGVMLAQARFAQQRYPEAIEGVHEALRHQVPDDPRIAFVLSRIFTESLLNSLEAPAAEDKTLELMRRYPGLGPPLAHSLAGLYERRGQSDKARDVLEAALEQFPDDPQLNNSVGYSLANAGLRLDDARRMIGKSVEAEPRTAAYLDSMGWVHYKLGELEEALDWLKRGRAAEGGAHPVILDHLGDTLSRLGRNAEAVRAWSEAQAILSRPGYESQDPEEEGLSDRLAGKIKAVADEAQPAVAPLGEGVAAP